MTLRPARRPTVLSQPEGANFTVDGHEVTWGQWRFHARIDARVGTVISVARWQDKSGPPRSVLYQGYLSEMFVPYMDSAYGWYTRTYFDTGEYGAGILASPLKAGVDCPATATFMPATFATETGEPMTTPNALCVFERSGGDPIWRHYEGLNQTYEGRANVELVVRIAIHDRQLRLSDGLGVYRRRGDRGPPRRHRHRRGQRCRDAEDVRRDGGRGHALRHARRAEPRRRQPRSLLQLPSRSWTWTARRTRSTTTCTRRRRCPTAPRGAASTSSSPRWSRTRKPPASIRATARRNFASSTKAGRTRSGNPVSYEVMAMSHARLVDRSGRLARKTSVVPAARRVGHGLRRRPSATPAASTWSRVEETTGC